MSILSKVEEILLLIIWKLGENAYGAAIFDQVEKETELRWLSGSIYGALTRLKKNGYVHTTAAKQRTEGVGRPRIYYQLTPLGLEQLSVVQRVNQSIWAGVPKLQGPDLS